MTQGGIESTCVDEIGGVVVFVAVVQGTGLCLGELLVFDFFKVDHGLMDRAVPGGRGCSERICKIQVIK